MTYLERIKGLSDEKFSWRIVKKGKEVVSMCSSFLTIGAVAISLLCGGINDSQAGPTGGQITSGTGSISQRNMTTTIDQESSRLDIDWRDFSSNVGDTITFNQPTSEAIAINRVTSGIPSNLRGELNANGRVFILNNAGVTFHKGSQTNVGSLIATTAKEIDIDDDGIAHFSDSGNAAIINEGDIIVSEGGFAVLVAPQVANHGFIRADLGRIEMGSATEFTFDLRGDGTIVYKLTEEELENAGLSNTGILQAKSGVVNLSANVASDIRKAVVNLDGLIDADSFGEGMDGGTVLVSSKGDINMNGTAKGEEIRVVADDTMNFNEEAEIEGGFAEVSGRENILFRGATKVDKLLIDPATMLIKDGSGVAGVNEIYEADIETLSQGGTDVVIEATDSIIMENLTDDELTGGSGNIELFGGAAGVADADTAISFTDLNDTIRTTSGDIIMDAGLGGINVGNLVTGGAAEVAPGSIELTTINGGNISTGSITIEGAGSGTGASLLAPFSVEAFASLVSDGDITINGDVDLSADADVLSGGYGEAYSLLDLRANATSGTTTVNGDVTVDASANGNDAAVVLSHSIVGIKSYDTSITGSLNQSSSLTGTYTQQADNYLYTLINEGQSVPSTSGFFNSLESLGRTDFEPIGHAAIYYNNASSNDVTIGGDVNSVLTSDATGPVSSDYTQTSIAADNGTLTISGTTNISQDITVNGNIYNKYLDIDMLGDQAVLGDVNITETMDASSAVTGDIDVYSYKDVRLYLDETITMGSYNGLNTLDVVAAGASEFYIHDYAGSSTTIRAADSIIINGDISATMDYNSTGAIDTIFDTDMDFYLGTSSTDTITVNGNVDMLMDIDMDGNTYSKTYQYVTLETQANHLTVNGDINVKAYTYVANAITALYPAAMAEYKHEYNASDSTLDANSIYILGDSLSDKGIEADSTLKINYSSGNADIIINITEGVDVVSKTIANGDITEGFYNYQYIRFRGNGNSVLNADYVNFDATIDTNDYFAEDSVIDRLFYLDGFSLNLENDLTIASVADNASFITNSTWSGFATAIYIENGASIDANNWIIENQYIAESSEGTNEVNVILDVQTYLPGHVDLRGDLIIDQDINIATPSDTIHNSDASVSLQNLDYFHANSIQADSDLVGATGEAQMSVVVNSGGDLTLDADSHVNMNVEYANSSAFNSTAGNSAALNLVGANITTQNIDVHNSVTGIEGDYGADALSDLQMYAFLSPGTATVGDVNITAYAESDGGEEANTEIVAILQSDADFNMGDFYADTQVVGTGEVENTEIDTYLQFESFLGNYTMGDVSSNAIIDVENGTYADVDQRTYMYAYEELNLDSYTQTSDALFDMTSSRSAGVYVENEFYSDTASITAGDVTISSNVEAIELENNWYSDRYTEFEALNGDINLGNFSQTSTGGMNGATPFVGGTVTATDEVTMTAGGNIDTGSQTVSSVATAENVSVDEAIAEVTHELFAGGTITTGDITTNAEVLVDRADEQYATADLRVENDLGNITANGDVFVNGVAEQTEIDDAGQILHARGSGIFNAEQDLTINGDFTSHGYTIADDTGVDADVFAQTFAWMMGGYGSAHDLDTDLAAGPMVYYPQYTTNKVLTGPATTTLGGELESLAFTIGNDGIADATASIISSSNDIWFANTGKDPLTMADEGFVQLRVWGQDPSHTPDIATLILLTEDPNPAPLVIDPTYRIPSEYEFGEYKYPRMRTEYIFFDWDKHELDEEAMKKLQRIYEEYQAVGISKLFIEGHTDLSGSDKYNEVLAKKRASQTSMMFEILGLDKTLHNVATLGEHFPYVPTEDGTKIRENRRVKIKYLAVE